MVLLCYDGSESARRAIEHSRAVLADREAIVLTIWESVGSMLLRHPFPERTELGHDMKDISEAVVSELDEGTASRARATAVEGTELAVAAGFNRGVRPMAVRALARAAERDTVTVWRAVLDTAEDEDVSAIVLGARGRSGLGTALLGSVSNGVVHHSRRPVLVVPPP